MNQPQSYIDVGPGHMSHSSVSSSTSGPPHYSAYHQPIQNGIPSYASSPAAYPGYGGYSAGIGSMPSATSAAGPMSGQLVHQSPLPLPMIAPPAHAGAGNDAINRQMDSSGQVAPPGMKPRVTATLWEDEGSLCFQVEAGGVCVARREDNHMINGTKLLNVAGMTRGRRDGILKSEKLRNVVKIGPMHLKGVWIPYERALDFANKEKITEQLYPLFVHNIGELLYHPPNSGSRSVSNATMVGADRRRVEGGLADYMRVPQTGQPPGLQHHHSQANSGGPHGSQPPHAIVPHPASGRPGLDRAHTFPTPPTSASSMMGMGNSGSSYEWGGASVVPATQPLSIDTGMNNTRSVPTTPASTPPANAMQGMPAYATSGSYDGARSMYGHSSHPSYSSQYGMPRYGQLQPSPSIKNEMGPPARAGHDEDRYTSHTQEHHTSSDAGDGEHDGDYTHSAGPYGQGRTAYGYNAHGNIDHSNVSPQMTGSPQKGPGRATPRTASGYGSYTTPQRAQQLPASNLYHVMGDNRNGPNGADMYNAGTYQTGQPPNGLPPPNKRVFEVDEDDENGGMKRQKTLHDDRPRAMVAQKKR